MISLQKILQRPLLALAILILGAQAHASAPLWADIDDIVTNTPKAMPDAALIQAALKKDAAFVSGQASFKAGLHLEYQPIDQSGTTVYRASALMSARGQGLFFRKFEIEVGGEPRIVKNVKAKEDVPLAKMHFQLSAGLIDRMLVVEDIENDITVVFPIGVGGIDDGVMGFGKRILTPRFQGAHINVASIIPARTSPAYYRGEPFIPITNAQGVQTPIGFHITILDDATWAAQGPNYLVRGFDSHGCMRLRQKDLRQLFAILKNGADREVPVNVDYFVWKIGADGERDQSLGQIREIHPYPLRDDAYQGVVNGAKPGQPPHAMRDPVEHLVVMSLVKRAPDLTHLRDFNADDLTDLKVFTGLSGDLNSER